MLPQVPASTVVAEMCAFYDTPGGIERFTTTFDHVLEASVDPPKNVARDISIFKEWLRRQGYNLRPRRFTREEVDKERKRRIEEEFWITGGDAKYLK